MKRGLLLLVLALLGASRTAHAREDDSAAGRFEAWLALGDTFGSQDYGVGKVNRNGWGGGLGVRAGAAWGAPRVSLGPWGGLEMLGGAMSSSNANDSGVYLLYRFEGGLQLVSHLDRTTVVVRAAKYWFNDSAFWQKGGANIDLFSGWLVRARVDHGVASGELGYGGGDFRYVEATLRWRRSGLACLGVTVEHFDSTDSQTAATHVRFFYAIDF